MSAQSLIQMFGQGQTWQTNPEVAAESDRSKCWQKKSRGKGKENKTDGGVDTDNTDDTGQPRSGAAGEPTKDITLYSR